MDGCYWRAVFVVAISSFAWACSAHAECKCAQDEYCWKGKKCIAIKEAAPKGAKKIEPKSVPQTPIWDSPTANEPKIKGGAS